MPYFLLKLTVIMAEEIVIDKNAFFNRLSSFYTAWKADKRSGNNATFGGVGSIVILMGKTDEENSFQKNSAMHVRLAPSTTFKRLQPKANRNFK